MNFCRCTDDGYVRECLELADLRSLLARTGIDSFIDDWTTTLSPGEVQRLCFARLFYHRPSLAGMRDVFSALGYCGHNADSCLNPAQ